MLSKLAVRNAKRSMKDYLVYLITMTGVAAFMFAFNSMIFSSSVRAMCSQAMVMGAMMGLATFFIVLIVAWLINYMVHFMLEKRSREFGTYLLLGMKKKEISRLYMRENLILGTIGLFVGTPIGIFLQQVLMTIFFRVFSRNYYLKIDITWPCIAMTLGCYYGCYLIAIIRNRRMFKKMSISDLMRMEKENEKIVEGKTVVKQWLLVVCLGYFAFFFYQMYNANYQLGTTILMIIFFIVAIYLFYIGMASFLVEYIKRGGERLYKKQNLFLYRQMASKLKTMQFTMGTLTILLTCAIVGGSVAMMFAKCQDKVLSNTMPFDVLVYSNNTNEKFAKELKLIEKDAGIKQSLTYHIYQDGTSKMNEYLYTHCTFLGSQYRNSDGSLNQEAVKKDDYMYYDYDTYMKLSDYNQLRKMLGLKAIALEKNEYAIQIKERLKSELNSEIKERVIQGKDQKLKLSAVYTDGFSQNGINGADYLIIIPDKEANAMKPYYTDLAVSTNRTPTDDLQQKLYDLRLKKNHILSESEFDRLVEEGKIKDSVDWDDTTLGGQGTDQVIVVVSDVMVSSALTNEMRFIITAVIFPTVYIGLVFLCVALTILAVQQLSDSSKYKFRYETLRKLGLNERELDCIVWKQLCSYYMVPAITALFLSAMIVIFAGNQFVLYTGAYGNGFYYYGIGVLLFFGVYSLYIAATYIGFKRNIRSR